MKKAIAFLVMVGFAAALGAQSLTDLARVEKARRKSLGGKHGPVVTNLDLLRVRIRPAVEVIVPEPETADLAEAADTSGELAAEAGGVASDVSAPPAAEPGAAPAVREPEVPDVVQTLRDKLQASEELIDLLKTKITALNQDYSYQANMVPNYVIEQQLTETLQRLQNAQGDAVRLRRELDKAILEKKHAANPIR